MCPVKDAVTSSSATGVGSGSSVVESPSSDQSDRSGRSGRVGDGGDGWSVTGSRVLSGGQGLSFLPGLVFLFPLDGIGPCGSVCGSYEIPYWLCCQSRSCVG